MTNKSIVSKGLLLSGRRGVEDTTDLLEFLWQTLIISILLFRALEHLEQFV